MRHNNYRRSNFHLFHVNHFFRGPFLDYPDYKRIIHLRNFCLQNTTVFWSKWTAMYHRRPIFDILDSSRLPEIFLPIDIIK